MSPFNEQEAGKSSPCGVVPRRLLRASRERRLKWKQGQLLPLNKRSDISAGKKKNEQVALTSYTKEGRRC